jgi:hypothetical protein
VGRETNVGTSILQSLNKLCAVSLTGARTACAEVLQLPCPRGIYYKCQIQGMHTVSTQVPVLKPWDICVSEHAQSIWQNLLQF